MAENTTEINLDELARVSLSQKIANFVRDHFVRKEAGKGLSSNDLTDELLSKINSAGTSDFDGAYESLSGLPTLDETEIKGALTAESLGLATKASVASATTDMATQTWVNEKGYATGDEVTTAVGTAKTELEDKIKAQISSVYTPKGSIAFTELPAPSENELGSIYNVTNKFTTTEDFVEGAGKKIAAGTNVTCVKVGDTYKWDSYAGEVDLTDYVQKSEIATVTDEVIASWFE